MLTNLRQTIRPVAVTMILLLSAVAVADEARTLHGSYVWDARGDSGDLRAEFKPLGENAWEVAFHFEFRGEKHVYSGMAEGTLADGALKGTVRNESKKRTFTFEGTVADGEFSGTHAETTEGRERDTGTLTLKL